MRETINAAIIRSGKILIVRKKESWLLPGGKPEPGETELETLAREIKEELSGAEIKEAKFYGVFEGKTHIGEDFRTKVYFARIDRDNLEFSNEISEYAWINSPEGYNFSDMNLKVFSRLKKEGYL